MSKKFIVGLSVGLIAGMIIISYSKDAQKFVEKSKNKIMDKIKEYKDKNDSTDFGQKEAN